MRPGIDVVGVATSPMVSQLTAAAGLFLLGLDRLVFAGATTGFIVVLALAPVWLRSLRHFHGATTVTVLTGMSLLAGVWLSAGAVTDHRVHVHNAFVMTVLVVSAVGGIGLILWARRVVPFHAVALFYASGALIAAISKAPTSTNAWKYELALPTTVIVLALVGKSKSWVATVLSLIALGVVGITNEYRSYFGFCLVAALLGLYDARPRALNQRLGRATIVVLMAGLVAAIYYTGSALLVGGYFGQTLQDRSTEQVERSGSLIIGGRPEWAATLQLMQDRPGGFGLGVEPVSSEIRNAKSGLDSVGLPPDEVRDAYMFRGQLKLHSVIADLWSNFGMIGLALGCLMLLLLINALATVLAHRIASALLVFLVLTASWDLLFGPIFTNMADVGLALGLSLLHRPSPSERRAREKTATRRRIGASALTPSVDPTRDR